MKLKLATILFFILIFSLSSNAVTEYNSVGTDNTDFRLGTGFWNSERTSDCSSGDIICSTRNLGSSEIMPFVNDLDNDGINEIIVFDGTTIRLYRGTTLEIVDGFTLSGIPIDAIIFDIDNDTRNEIIVHYDNTIEIIEYNGTVIQNQTNPITVLPLRDSFGNIQCRGIDDCIVFGIETSGTPVMYSMGFNRTTNFTMETSVLTAESVLNSICYPTIRSIPVVDYDNDGILEYVMSVSEGRNAVDSIRILFLDVNETDVIAEQTITKTSDVDLGATGCTDRRVDGFTSPLVFDIDGFPSTGLETVIGVMISGDDFKMFSFNSGGSALDDYPEVTNGEGVLVSNVMRANIFTDTDSEDFCVLGYENTANLLNLICASEQTSSIPETTEFDFDTTGFTFNVTAGYQLVIHSTQQDSGLTDGNNLDEITTSYGIFKLDFVLFNELILIWENPQGDSILYNIDTEQIGVDDLLILTSSNIWYFDDAFVNQNAQVSIYITTPSILSAIQLNQTPQVNIECIDEEGDNVQARLITYLGQENQQDTNFSTLSGSGATFPFTFEANQTTAISSMRLMCRDSNHNVTSNVTVSFSVSIVGASVGDSVFDSGDLLEVDVDELADEINTTRTDNVVRDAIVSFSNQIRMPPTLLMLIMIAFLFLGTVIVLEVAKLDIKFSIYFGIAESIFMVMIFTYLRLIATALVVTIFFFLIVFGVIFIYTKFNHNATSN